MSISEEHETSDEVSVGDFFRPLLAYRQVILTGSLLLIAAVAIAAGVSYLLQPARWTASIGFRPLFAGIELGQYPNKLPFAGSDIVDSTILDQVFDSNHLQDFCKREDFEAALAVDESSPELQVLELDYLGRLSDARLTAVDRARIQDEYLTRRKTVPRQFRLTFVQSGCNGLPVALAGKVLNDVLQTWASESERKRGVLKAQVAVLTPAIFDSVEQDADQSLLVRADLIRSELTRLITNVTDVERLSGADLVRDPTTHKSLAEVRAQLEDVVGQLDPLVATAGRGLGQESVRWVEQALASATTRHEAADQHAQAYLSALREYSGTATAPPANAPPTQRPQSDVQTLMPQIDRTFIDKIVELSADNTKFRQEITREMVDASVEAIDSTAAVAHYQQLLTALKADDRVSLTSAEVTSRLGHIVARGTQLAKQFDDLYDEYSRVSLRPGPLMYRIETPVTSVTVRSFTIRTYATIVIAAALVIPILLMIGCLVHYRLREAAARQVHARA
jgi:hypothetical protein